MPSRDLVVRIDGDTSGFERSMKSAQSSASVFERELRKAEAAEAKRHQAMTKLGTTSMVAGAAMAAGVALAANAAVKWETAWAGVTKTVNGSSAQMQALETDLRDLAKTLPATHGEIAAVAEAAGQLGVQRKNIAGFTKVMIDLGVSTNLSSDEAATAIARFSNVMGTMDREGTKGIERLGATLVALGNQGASTEADIMDMAMRLAGVGKLIGASESDVLALANAMSSMGIESENGAGVMSRSLLKIYTAVKSGGAALEGFAKVAGMSGAEFTRAFGQDPVRAAGAFVQGLSRIEAGGGNVVETLDDLGISGSRDLQVLLSLKGAGDLLNDSLDVGNKAWRDNTALVNEANKRYDTTASKMKIAKNQVNDLAIDLGQVLLPMLGKASSGVSGFAGFLGDLPGPAKQAMTILGLLGATVGILGGAAFITVPKVAAMKAALATLNVSAKTTDRTMKALSATMKAGAIAGGIVGVALAVDQLVKALAKNAPGVNALQDSLLDFATTGKASGAVAEALGGDVANLSDVLDKASKNRLAEALKGTFGTSIIDVQHARDVIEGFDEAFAALVSSGHGDAVAVILEKAGVAADVAIDRFPKYKEALHGVSIESKEAKAPVEQFNTALGATKEEAEAAQKAIDALAEIVAGFVSPLGAYQTALSTAEDASRESAEKSADAYNDSIDEKVKATQRDYDARIESAREAGDLAADEMRNAAATADAAVNSSGKKVGATAATKNARRDAATALKNDTRDTVQALEDERDSTLDSLGKQKKSWEDYAKGVSVSVAAYLAELEKQVEAQRNWQANMLALSSRVSKATLDELAKLGPEGAPLIAKLVTASDKELARLEAAFKTRTDAAAQAWALGLTNAQPVLTAIAQHVGAGTAKQLADALAAGKTTVAAIMKKYGYEIENGVVIPARRAKTGVEAIAEALEALDGKSVTVTVNGINTAAGVAGKLAIIDYAADKAAGGYISGPGTSTSDSIPANLSNGEYVQQAKAVRYYGRDFMDDLNALRVPARGFSTGGYVSQSRAVTNIGGATTIGGTDNRKIELHVHGDVTHDGLRDAEQKMRDAGFRNGWY